MQSRCSWTVTSAAPDGERSGSERSGASAHGAFTRYVLPEVEVLARVAASMERNPADAEDLVQETLLRAYRGIATFDGAHPRAWLLTIMRNTQANRYRRRRHLVTSLEEGALGMAEADPDVMVQPEGATVGAGFDAVVVSAFESLSPRHRRLIQLVDMDGLSYREAAVILGVPVGTVMSGLHRARGRIRRRLAASGVAPKGARR